MSDNTTNPTLIKQVPITARVSLTQGPTTTELIIEDVSAVAAAIAGSTGNVGLGNLILALGTIAGRTIGGFEAGKTIVINQESIDALFVTKVLDPPTRD